MDTEKYTLQCDAYGWSGERRAYDPSECPTCKNNQHVLVFGSNGALLWDSGQQVKP